VISPFLIPCQTPLALAPSASSFLTCPRHSPFVALLPLIDKFNTFCALATLFSHNICFSRVFLVSSYQQPSEARRIFKEARAKRVKRVKRIEWINVSSVVDVASHNVLQPNRGIHREYSRLHQGSLASLAHLPAPLVPCSLPLTCWPRSCPRCWPPPQPSSWPPSILCWPS